jgi:hypothetical protein
MKPKHSIGLSDPNANKMGDQLILPSLLVTFGASKNETLRNQANTKLLKTFYGGERNRFDWSKYVSIHKRCHNELEATGPPLGKDKGRQLLNGIN